MPDTCGVGGWGGPAPGDPSNNSTLTATPAFGGIDVNWTYPSTNPQAVAYTKIFRSATNNFGSAILIKEISGTYWFDRVNSAIQYYYWIVIVSVHGTPGSVIGPASAIARPLLLDLMEELTAQIDSGLLATTLRDELDQISIINANLANEITDRETGDTTLAEAMADVNEGLAEAHTFILNEIATRTSETSALAEQIDGVVATLGDDIAAVTVAMTAYVDDTLGAVGAMYVAKLTVNGLVGGFGIYNDSINVEAGFDVDTFWVGRTDGDKVKPFIIDDGVVYIKEAVIPILTADKIDTRELDIRDAAGNILFSSGVNLDYSRIVVSPQWLNNLIDPSFWQMGASLSVWAPLSGATNSIQQGIGPDGQRGVFWEVVADSSGGGSGSGGWNQGPATPIDTTKTYRFVIPIYRLSGNTGSAWWGVESNQVCNLNTTTPNTNPYFVNGATPTVGRWCLYVGYVFPYGSTGNTNDGAGIYDMVTGALLSAGTNWNWASGVTVVNTRAYQYYASSGSTQYFDRPRVDRVDGGEPPLAALLASGSTSGRNPITAANVSTYIANAAIGDAQIGGDIKSTIYTPGSNGWIIRRDGTAEFDAVTIRGQLVTSQFQVGSISQTAKTIIASQVLYSGSAVNTLSAIYVVGPTITKSASGRVFGSVSGNLGCILNTTSNRWLNMQYSLQLVNSTTGVVADETGQPMVDLYARPANGSGESYGNQAIAIAVPFDAVAAGTYYVRLKLIQVICGIASGLQSNIIYSGFSGEIAAHELKV